MRQLLDARASGGKLQREPRHVVRRGGGRREKAKALDSQERAPSASSQSACVSERRLEAPRPIATRRGPGRPTRERAPFFCSQLGKGLASERAPRLGSPAEARGLILAHSGAENLGFVCTFPRFSLPNQKPLVP